MSRRSEFEKPDDATVARGKRGKRKRAETEIRASTPRSRRGRRSRLPLVLLFLGVVVFFLPNLIGWVGLQNFVINYGLADFNGNVSANRASLGWFKPIELTDVTATDAQGKPMIRVAKINSSKTLLSFVTTSDYGQFVFIRPVIELEMRPDGNNVEDAIAKYLVSDPDDHEPFRLPKFSIKISEGQINVASGVTSESWRVDQLDLIVQASSEVASLSVAARCRIAPSTIGKNGSPVFSNAGSLEFSGQIDPGSELFKFEAAEFNLDTQGVALSVAGPIIQRISGPTAMTGNLSGKISGRYDMKTESFSLVADRLNTAGFSVTAPGLLGSDQISVANMTAQGSLRLTSTLISADQFEVQSDFGWIKADGSFDINQVANLATQGKLLDTPFKMDGEIDLVQLFRMLPSTLQLHDDLVVDSGTINFQASSRKENGNRRMVVNLDTANLKGRRGGQAIFWGKPFRLVGAIQESNGRIAIENVECVSDFLTIRGRANRQSAAFVTQGDISKLMQRVGEFVDLQGTRLEGVFEGRFGWDELRAEASPAAVDPRIQITGHFDFSNLLIQMPEKPIWQQSLVSVELGAVGKVEREGKIQLNQGSVRLGIATEQLTVKLSDPVADIFANPNWSVDYEMAGSLAGWLGFVGSLVDVGEIAMGGNLRLTGKASLGPTELQLSKIEYVIENLVIDQNGLKIRESKTTGSGALVYDWKSGEISIPDIVLSSSSISARGQPLKINLTDNLQIDGSLAFRADVNRIAEWIELSADSESVFWFGSLEGTVQLVSNENGIGGRLNSTISNLVAAKQVTVPAQQRRSGQMITVSQPTRAWKEILREPTVELSGDVSFENDFDSIRIHNLVLNSVAIQVTADGSIVDLGGAMDVDFLGKWTPNWDKLNVILNESTGGIMRFAGQREQKFSFRGPMIEQSAATMGQTGSPTPWLSPKLQASIGFGWDRGEILNLPVGQSQIELDVQQSVARLTTSGVPFAGGRVQFAPQIDMRGEAPIMTLVQTRVIDHVELKAETARQWLRYVAPFLAESTSARGIFTVDIDEARVPLLDPMRMEVKGSVQLSDVVVGAGPITEQLLTSVHQIRTLLNPGLSGREQNVWLKLSEQTVPVIIQEGRMYHQGLVFSHKDIVIRTQGSVGFDQTIDIVAQIAIADEWIAHRPLLAGLQGRTISIPITGTISNPKLDLLAIQRFTSNLAKEALGNAFKFEVDNKIQPKVNELQNEFNNKLNSEFNKFQNKLFGK